MIEHLFFLNTISVCLYQEQRSTNTVIKNETQYTICRSFGIIGRFILRKKKSTAHALGGVNVITFFISIDEHLQ